MKRLVCLLLIGLSACRSETPARLNAQAASRPSSAPVPDFGQLPAPPDNPVTQAKVELGFRLWFEPRLSAGNRMTCATCHNHTMGFSNAQTTAAGVTGVRGDRNVPTIYAAVNGREMFWDGRAASLEAQALGPIENPVEMNAQLPEVLAKLQQVPYYAQKFQQVFGTPPTATGMAQALASFERALALAPSPYERFVEGDSSALDAAQQRGMQLFFSSRTRCQFCHQGPDLSNRTYVNIGIGMDKPQPDLGRYKVTGMEWDKGSFKVPTLRNIALTAPYMHDGSLPTLLAVIEHYDRGGIPNPQLDPRIGPLHLSAQEKADLVAFLRALSAPDNLRALGQLPGIHLPAAELEALLKP